MQKWMQIDGVQLFVLALIGFGLFICVPVDGQSGGAYNQTYDFKMCVNALEYVDTNGAHGTIFYSKYWAGTGGGAAATTIINGCALTLKTCRQCKFKITVSNEFRYERCSQNVYEHTSECYSDCTYLMIYEPSYPKQTTSIFYQSQDNLGTFSSVSSSVVIKFCFGKNNFFVPEFRLKFETLSKDQTIQSSSGHFYSRGILTSPFFPNHYATKDEIYTYRFRSVNNDDHIQLVFNDWNLSPTSELKFLHSNVDAKIYRGNDYRPAIVSRANYLTMTFVTGRPSSTGNDYMGFNLTYIFGFDRNVVIAPRTDCGGFYSQTDGGILTLDINSPYKIYEKFDCVWVVKQQEYYDGLFIRLVDLQTNTRAPDFQIRDGATSNGMLLFNYPQMRKDFAQSGYYSTSGAFYVRLTGYISKEDVIKLTYVSFRSSFRCHSSEMFNCDDDRCINSKFKCDGDAQCPTWRDESSTECKPSTPDDGYEYTISISIIIPLVVSVFVVIIVCLLAMFIHRCRKVSQHRSGHRSASRSGGRHQRRRGRRSQIQMNLTINDDSPPSYEEVIRSAPIGYLNMGFAFNQPDALPSLPSYAEAVGNSMSGPMILSASSLQHSDRSHSSGRSVTTDSSEDPTSNNDSRHTHIPEQRVRSSSNISRHGDSNVDQGRVFQNSPNGNNIPSKRNTESPYGLHDQLHSDMSSVNIYNSSDNCLEVVNDDRLRVSGSPNQKHSKHNRRNKSQKTHNSPSVEVRNPRMETILPRDEDARVRDRASGVESEQNLSAQNRKKKRKKTHDSPGERRHDQSNTSGSSGSSSSNRRRTVDTENNQFHHHNDGEINHRPSTSEGRQSNQQVVEHVDARSSLLQPSPSTERAVDYSCESERLQEVLTRHRANRQLVLALTKDSENEEDIYV